MPSAIEAWEWAADYADRAKLFEPIRNERGYADQWKPPSPADKLEVIRKIALSVTDTDDKSLPAPEADANTVGSWVKTLEHLHHVGIKGYETVSARDSMEDLLHTMRLWVANNA